MNNNTKPKVLIIEDEKNLLDMYTLKFAKDGFEVTTAKDGETGLAQAKQDRPDIILLDVMMPKLDGFRVLEELKALPEFKNTPVILLTNLGQEEDVKKGQDLGAVDYLVKTNNTPAQVVAKVKQILKL